MDDADAALERTEAARRKRFYETSVELVPGVPEDMCFYDPAEVLEGLQSNEVALNWHKYMLEEYEPEPNKYAIIFPETDRKPWTKGNTVDRAYKNLYISLKTLKLEGKVQVFTISNLLGVIAREDYDKMPLYDASGLYSWSVRQKGLTWDLDAFRHCLDIIASILCEFVHKHKDKYEEWHVLYRTPSIQERVMEHTTDINPFPYQMHKFKKPIASSYSLIKDQLKGLE